MPKSSDILDSRLYELETFGSSDISHGHSPDNIIYTKSSRSGGFHRELIIDESTWEITEVISQKRDEKNID